MVKEIYVSNTVYGCSEAVAQSEIAEKELGNSDQEKLSAFILMLRIR